MEQPLDSRWLARWRAGTLSRQCRTHPLQHVPPVAQLALKRPAVWTVQPRRHARAVAPKPVDDTTQTDEHARRLGRQPMTRHTQEGRAVLTAAANVRGGIAGGPRIDQRRRRKRQGRELRAGTGGVAVGAGAGGEAAAGGGRRAVEWA
jgi:hypothetical protein